MGVLRPAGLVLQFLILIFSLSFVYFIFVYYPNVERSVSFSIPFGNVFGDKVIANAEGFPIVTNAYRITYESDSTLYYVFIEGSDLNTYVENKLSAQLALKNTLDADSICHLKIIYTSASRLELGQEYKTTSGC